MHSEETTSNHYCVLILNKGEKCTLFPQLYWKYMGFLGCWLFCSQSSILSTHILGMQVYMKACPIYNPIFKFAPFWSVSKRNSSHEFFSTWESQWLFLFFINIYHRLWTQKQTSRSGNWTWCSSFTFHKRERATITILLQSTQRIVKIFDRTSVCEWKTFLNPSLSILNLRFPDHYTS